MTKWTHEFNKQINSNKIDNILFLRAYYVLVTVLSALLFFSQALWRHNWQTSLKDKVYIMMIWYVYILWKDSSHLVNQHIFIFFCGENI